MKRTITFYTIAVKLVAKSATTVN